MDLLVRLPTEICDSSLLPLNRKLLEIILLSKSKSRGGKPPFADFNADYLILLRSEGFYQLLKTRCLRLSMLLSLAFARFHTVSKTFYSMSCILLLDAQRCGS